MKAALVKATGARRLTVSANASMPYALKKLPQAEVEAHAAAAWYEEQKPGLGFDLLDRVDDAVASLLQNPFRYGLRFGDVRRAPVRRFKFYGVYYFIQREEAVIISVFNDRQDPARLRERRAQVDPFHGA